MLDEDDLDRCLIVAPLFDASGQVLAVVDVVGPVAGEPGSVGSAVPINDAAHVIADSLAN